MFEALRCHLSVHEPYIENFGDHYQSHREYRYACARLGCGWHTPSWTELQNPPPLPWQMRLLRLRASAENNA
jgi:hypothetical protein